jgi:radical SAM superfamily enzyme YgiQ (UPF0313 family)
MRIVVVGADFEENLGLGLIAASLEAVGHRVHVVAFQDPAHGDEVVDKILARKPDLVGLSIQFQHRAHEFLRMAHRLRALGFRGHLTCGGQFPTLAWREVMHNHKGIDSIVLHEGEHTIVELADALLRQKPLARIAGLALRDDRQRPFRTEGRPLPADLDRLPFPKRYRPHTSHVGVPFIPISGSRGCWGRCSYCSITSFYRDAREHGGGRLLRLRSPRNIAAEMALLWHGAGGPSVFCFHDDNFLLPRPEDTLERVREILSHLDAFGVGKVGLIGKCRPETLTPSLAKELRTLGVVRLYIGIENASQGGSDHLCRRTSIASVRQALDAAREAGIFACYNLLIFEPEATLDEVRENIAFMREHASHPVNFCRAEPYHGTPLHLGLVGNPGIGGSYLGWDYRIADDRTELLFRICAAAFRERNFAARGVANRTMGLGYSVKLLEHFYDERPAAVAKIRRQADEVTRGIVLETADFLEEALRLAQSDDRELVERETALLGLRISAFDSAWHAILDDLQSQMEKFVAEAQRLSRPTRPTRKLIEAVQGLAVMSLLSVGVSACGGRATSDDPVPPDAGFDAEEGGDSSGDVQVSDPLPEDAGMEDVMVSDPPPWDSGFEDQVSDPPPWDSGFEDQVSDPLPEDGGFSDNKAGPLDHWRDSTPHRSERSRDLPLFEPPAIQLSHARVESGILVRALGGSTAMTMRWEGDGVIEGDGREVLWRPGSDSDQLRLGVRTRGGVAIVSLRARDA